LSKHHDEATKAKALERLSAGERISAVAAAVGVHVDTVRNWSRAANAGRRSREDRRRGSSRVEVVVGDDGDVCVEGPPHDVAAFVRALKRGR
jgi:transposase-like protein